MEGVEVCIRLALGNYTIHNVKRERSRHQISGGMYSIHAVCTHVLLLLLMPLFVTNPNQNAVPMPP